MVSSGPFLRRLFSSAIDAGILLLVPILWWHWTEWARYTSTFGGQWPASVAMPVMTLLPLTLLWLEAFSGRGAGKAILRLRVTNADSGEASLGRRLWRSALKWSPAWIGPAVRLIDLAVETSLGDDFTNDHLLPWVNTLAEQLPGRTKQLAWALGVSLRGMNVGVIALLVLAVGQLLIALPGRRSLLDRLSGTKVVPA